MIIRKDYFLDRWVYYAIKRKKRPMEFKESQAINEGKICFFCQENNHLTPPEIGRLEYKNTWKIRWFLNKFPAVELKDGKIKSRGKFLSEGKAYGTHEIIVESQEHKKQLWDLDVNHI